MNDRHELEYGMGVFNSVLKEFQLATLPKSEMDFLESIEEMLNRYNHAKEIYAFCLSEQADLLSQWRGYGGGGRGYSLGMDLSHLPRDDPNDDDAGRPQLMPIVYGRKPQHRIVRAGLEEALKFFREKEEQGKMADAQSVMIAGSWVAADFDILRSVFKDDAFSEEQEWRIIHPRTPSTRPSPLKFRTADGYGIPYVELAIHPAKGDYDWIPLREIILGPKVEFDAASLGLRLLLREQGTRTGHEYPKTVNIRRSSIPFRSL